MRWNICTEYIRNMQLYAVLMLPSCIGLPESRTEFNETVWKSTHSHKTQPIILT